MPGEGTLGWREDEGGACGEGRTPRWGSTRLEVGHARLGGGRTHAGIGGCVRLKGATHLTPREHN
jgi:hypothetical protein